MILDYEAIRDSIAMEQLLCEYGIVTQRGMALCPFHDDHNPSMKVYADGFYCFACGTGGDIINFVARIDQLSNKDAAIKISYITGLPVGDNQGVVDHATKQRQQELQRRKIISSGLEKAERFATDVLCNYAYYLRDKIEQCAPRTPADMDNDARMDAYALANSRLLLLDMDLDILTYGSVKEKVAFLMENQAKIKRIALHSIKGDE